MRIKHIALMAVALITAMSSGVAQEVVRHIAPRAPRPRPRSNMTREQRTEIQTWNDAVQAKRDSKMARKGRSN